MSIALARRAVAVLALVVLAPCANAQSISYTGVPVPPQSFDTLAVTGTSTSLPNGWYLDDPDDAYLADDGTATSGNAYSYGSTGSSERALGSIASNSTPSVVYGAQLSNDTGSTLTSLDIGLRKEIWRRGDAAADKLVFAYSTDATSLATGTWTNFPALDVTPPSGGAVGIRDGNAPGNFATLSGTLTGISVAPGAKLWVRWSELNASGADDALAIDDVRFGPAGDFPPAVTSTAPLNGATGVAVGANVTINFSEPVNASGAWYGISCATSGAHPAVVSGGPQSFVLDPSTDFAFGETCTVSIYAAQVVDLDGTADPMAADYDFVFTTGADTAPVVASTQPVAGAGAVAINANVVVNFSEPVTVSTGWYAIACATSGAHTAVVTGGPTSYTLNPDVDFANSESCTVTIESDFVADQDGAPTQMAADYPFTFGTAATAGNYYAGIDPSSPASLRTGLYNRIKGHVAFTYFGAWTILEAADQDPLNANRILDVYRNRTYTKGDCRSGATSSCPTGASNRYNREHTWPNSHGFNDLDGLDGDGNPYPMYTDAHMLYLSAEDYNSNRGNKYYGNCSGCSENPTDAYNGYGGGTGVYPGNSNWSGSAAYEVWNHRKGDMARAVLYMDVRYEGLVVNSVRKEPDLIVTDDTSLASGTTPSGQVPAVGYMGLKSVLVAWSNQDPPDDQERLRNDVVYSFQQNRNPFIDHPEWVNCLYATPPVCGSAPPPDAVFANGFE
ncbi:MAG TPA: endonuclease [Xanthomonadales bacterium]|nr:endonuclease [Xanthomonadales bacterium]